MAGEFLYIIIPHVFPHSTRIYVQCTWTLILQLNMPYFELTLYNLLLVGRKGKGGPSSGKVKKAVNVAGEF